MLKDTKKGKRVEFENDKKVESILTYRMLIKSSYAGGRANCLLLFCLAGYLPIYF